MINNVENMTDEELKKEIDNFCEGIKTSINMGNYYVTINSRNNLDDFYYDVKDCLDNLYNFYINLSDYKQEKDTSIVLKELKLSEYVELYERRIMSTKIDDNIAQGYVNIYFKLIDMIDAKRKLLKTKFLDGMTEDEIKAIYDEIISMIGNNPDYKLLMSDINQIYTNYINISYDSIKQLYEESENIHDFFEKFSIKLDDKEDSKLYSKIKSFSEIISFKTKHKIWDIIPELYMKNLDYVLKEEVDKIFLNGDTFIEYLLSNIDVNFARKIVYEYDVKYVKYIPENIFKELSSDDLVFLINRIDDYSVLSKEKIKIVIESLGLIKTLELRSDNSEIYKVVENIGEEEFNYILANKLYYGIEECKSVFRNKKYINKLFNAHYADLLYGLEDDYVDEDILEYIKEKKYVIFFHDKQQLKSDKIIDMLIDEYDFKYDKEYDILLEKIPLSKLSLERKVKCALCGKDKTGIINESIIEEFISSGFKLKNKVHLDKEILKLFLNNKETYVIDLLRKKKEPFYDYSPEDELLSIEMLDLAVENGYKFSASSNYMEFPAETLQHFLQKENYDVIIPYSLSEWKIKDVKKYIQESGYSSIFKFAEEKGLDTSFFENIILSRNVTDLFSNDYNYIEERYSNGLTILRYISFLKEKKSDVYKIMNSFEDINKYFNEYGPKKELYDELLCNKELFNDLFADDSYLKFYSLEEDASIRKYIEFTKKYGLVFNGFIKNKSDISKYFNEFGYTEELRRYFRENPDFTENFLSDAVHNNNILENLDSDFTNIFEYYLIDKCFDTCENPKEKYDYLLKNIGPKILFSFGSETINKMLQIDNSELDIFFNLFDLQNKIISKQDANNNMAASLVDYKFKKEHKDIVEVFTNMRAIIDHMGENELTSYLNNKVINDKTAILDLWVNKIITELNYNDEQVEILKKSIWEYKENSRTKELHEICKKYLGSCEKKYAIKNQDNILLEFGITPEYDIEDKAKAYTSFLLQNITYSGFINLRDELFDKLNDGSIKGYEKLKTLSNEQFDLIIEAIKNRQQPDNSIKQEFSILKKFVSKISSFYIENNLIKEEEYQELDFTGIRPAVKLEEIDMQKIVSELDIEVFLNYAKENPKVLENLRKIINNYGLGRLQESIEDVFYDNYDLDLCGINNIGSFITKYYQILRNEKKRLNNLGEDVEIENIHLPFAKVMEAISLANSETYELRRLVGKSEYYAFAADKGHNASSYDRKSREDALGDIVDYLYTLGGVTIPSEDIIIESKHTNKKINFIVGNRTNPSNICHGEKTDACMRVGGVGEGLFLKCLTDKNWFHIRIEDPVTHEYVSRVSGFRNGNTVYLNQLRYAASGTNYTNEDLQEYIKIYAKQLIEETKNSKYPVENVFINNRYAMETVHDKIYNFGDKIQKEYNLDDVSDLRLSERDDIWTDVRNNAFLLATTEEGKKTKEGYVPLKNGPENAEIYKAVRDKIYGFEYCDEETPKHCFIEVDRENLIEKINRVHAMREKLLGGDYRYDIEDEINEDVQLIDGYASADWFVYLDSENNIHKEYISEIETEEETILYHQTEEAEEEMERYTEILMRKHNLESKMVHAV